MPQHIVPNLKNFNNPWETKSMIFNRQERVTKPPLWLWDSREPQWELLSTNGKHMGEWWTFTWVWSLPVISPRFHWQIIQEQNKTKTEQHLKLCRPRWPKLRKEKLDKNGFNGRDLRWNQKDAKSRLIIEKNMSIPKTFRKLLCADRMKVEHFGVKN